MPQSAPAAPYPQAAAPIGKPKGAIGIWIGILLIVGGIILGVVLVVSGVNTFIDSFGDLERVSITEGGSVDIDSTGTKSIFVEKTTTQGGTSFNTGSVNYSGMRPDVEVTVIGPDGDPVTVSTSYGSTNYVHNYREGLEIGTFYADQPGRYAIQVEGGGDAFPYTTIAVGELIDTEGILGIVGGVFGGGALVLLGIILVIVFAVRRSRSKKRIAQASNPYGGGYGAPAVAGWPTAPTYAGPGAAPGYGAPTQTWQPPPAPGWVPPPADVPSAPTPAAPPWQPTGDAPPPPPPADAPPPPPPAQPGGVPWDPPASGPPTDDPTT